MSTTEQKALELAEAYAEAYAEAFATFQVERFYGTSTAYTAEKQREVLEAQDKLFAELCRLSAENESLRAQVEALKKVADGLPWYDFGTRPAVPEGLRKEALDLASILSGMVEGSSPEPEVLWSDDYQPADGDVYVHRAALVLELLAAAPRPEAQPTETAQMRQLLQRAITEAAADELDPWFSAITDFLKTHPA